jgi:P27 family predicted phage terminase small subunit
MPRKSRAELDAPPPVRLVESALPDERPPPPAHLSESTQAWWRNVVEAYALEPHHLRQLECGCDAWDRMIQARALLLKEGLTTPTRDGVKSHPAVAIEKDSRKAFLEALRELDLDCPEPSPGPYQRPPAIRSNRRR